MSITGQVGHVAFSRQTGQGTPNVTPAQLIPVKITGDSLVSTNNPLIAEGEIGMGRDVSDAVPGGFQSAGAVNGNLRARAGSILLEAALGNKVLGGSADTFTPTDYLSWYTIEKQVGSATPQQLVIQYSDSMVNTLSISAPSAALATYSANVITAFEARTDRTNLTTPLGGQPSTTTTSNALINTTGTLNMYPSTSDDLLVFHGGRIFLGDNPSGVGEDIVGGLQAAIRDDTWQSVEIVINNNIAADEYTVRPSRFLRSLTMGIRQIDANFTLVFENPDKYSRFAYGAQMNNSPGYSFYMGALQVFLGNFQLLNPALDGVGSAFPYVGAANVVQFQPATPGVNVYNPAVGAGGATPIAPGAGPQFIQMNIPKLAFTGFPVALASGRIAVTTTARALKDPNALIMTAYVGPGGAGLAY